MKKYFIFFLIMLSGVFINTWALEIETPEDADAHVNRYYPQTVYNGGVNRSNSQNDQEAYVDPATGDVIVKVTDVKLPGKGGFDLSISRTYNSSNAALFEGYLEENDTNYSDALLDETANERYSKLGIGWEFDFPYIETRYGYTGTERYLHFGDKGTWRIDFSNGGSNNLDGYALNDIKIFQTHLDIYHDGIYSAYKVIEKDGTKHHFAKDGRLLIQEDRYGNRIKFYHQVESYMTVDGNLADYPYITKIVDTLEREIVFTYETDSYGNRYIYITMEDPDDAENKRVYTYYLGKLNNNQIGILNSSSCQNLVGNNWVLYSVTDPTGYNCTYLYEFLTTKFTFLDKNSTYHSLYSQSLDASKGNSYVTASNMEEFSGIPNRYALLREACGYKGSNYVFIYAPFVKNCSLNGSMIFYKAYISKEHGTRNYEDDSYAINQKTYTYDINNVGEYDGYINYDFEDEIPSSHCYAVKVADSNRIDGKTSFDIYEYNYVGTSFDKTMLLGKHTDQGTDHKFVTTYTYQDETNLVTNVSSTNYLGSNQSITTSMEYMYDPYNYGNVLSETPNGDEDRTVRYSYDEIYHYPSSKTYKRNATTTIEEIYFPTDDHKSISDVYIYENDIMKSKERYTYDEYRKIVSKMQYINKDNYIVTAYTYQDDAYVATKTRKKVADNDGVTRDVTETTAYDYWGNPISVTDAEGNTTLYTYNLSGELLSITNPDGSQKTYEYNDYEGCHDVIEEDELGNRVRTTYLCSGKPESIWDDSNGLMYKYFFYDPFGNVATEVRGRDFRYSEDLSSDLSVTHYTYDTAQRPISKEIYNNHGDLLYRETHEYGVNSGRTWETVIVWGEEDTPLTVTAYQYDIYGNNVMTTTNDPEGNAEDLIEYYTWDYVGNMTSVTSRNAYDLGLGTPHTFEYDMHGNVTKETDELGGITRAEYDWFGRMTKSYDQNGYASEYKYDAMGRVIEQKVPFEEKDGIVYYSVKKMWYDGNGNVIKEKVLTNSAGESDAYSEVNYTYDNRNNLVMTETSDGETAYYTQYYHDAKGNVLRTYTGLTSPLTIHELDDVTEGEDTEYAVTKYTYDKYGNVTEVTDPLGNSETYTYDTARGLVVSSTDRNGQSFTYTYDALGNLIEKSFSDGTENEYTEYTSYNPLGKIESKSNSSYSINYSYNGIGQLERESNEAEGTVKTYIYDGNGNRFRFELERNGITEISLLYDYDALDRLVWVGGNGASVYYSYDNKGNRVKTISNGITTEYEYNLANMLTSQTTGNKLTESYTYYLNGNQKSKTSNGETTNYVYDKMNRLIRENDTVYTFDDFGNRKTMTSGDTTTTYTYDLNNRLTESNEVTGDFQINTQYFYDANGNKTIKAIMSSEVYDGASAGHTVSDDTNEYLAIYDYNCYNQLVGVDANGVVSSYTYFPDGMRATKTVGDDTTTFVYDGANIIEEITPDGTNKYYRGLEIVKNSDGLCYLYNGQGDVAMLVDSTGNTVANYTFDAYGNTDSQNTVYNPFGYRGEYADSASGLIYLRARFYDPSTGRFINEDPARDGLNWYVYCENNPIMFVDPTGLTIVALTEIAAERGLSVSWNGESGADWAVTVDGHIITLNYQHTDGDWHLNLDGFAQSGNELSLHSADNKVYIDDRLFNCWINDGSGVTDESWMIDAAILSVVVGGKAGISIAKGISLAKAAKTAEVGVTVLGSYPHYLEKAQELGARVFSVPIEIWNAMTKQEQWIMNKQFLDESISMGHQFIMSNSANMAKPGTFFYQEVQYLLEQGYKIVENGMRMIK